jgi:hypothetical protein
LSGGGDRERERQGQSPEEGATLPKEGHQGWSRLIGVQPFVITRLRPLRIHALPYLCIE